MGIKPRGGGPHQSKTMMLEELTTLMASGRTEEPGDAIVRDNLLGKPSIRAREAALYRLRQLYGVGAGPPIGADLDTPMMTIDASREKMPEHKASQLIYNR